MSSLFDAVKGAFKKKKKKTDADSNTKSGMSYKGLGKSLGGRGKGASEAFAALEENDK